jgi:hypothetical protein
VYCEDFSSFFTHYVRRVLYLIAIWGTEQNGRIKKEKRERNLHDALYARMNFYRLNFFSCVWMAFLPLVFPTLHSTFFSSLKLYNFPFPGHMSYWEHVLICWSKNFISSSCFFGFLFCVFWECLVEKFEY